MSATQIQITPEVTGSQPPAAPGDKPEGQQPTQSTETPQRPDWLPEKFWKDGKIDQESLAKSYVELERSKSQPKSEAKPGEKPEAKPGDKPEDTPPEQLSKDEAFKPYFEEFETKGELSDESFKALEAKGIPRAVVEQYIEGSKAVRTSHTAKVFESVGGEENYKAMLEWAGENLSPEEQSAYNDVAVRGKPAEVSLAVAGLYAKYSRAAGSPARLVRGTSSASGAQPFRSSAEVTAAMSDPRYATDSGFRQEVMERLRASDVM